jgi:FKBP-type peptidyl-prolyl cis-trans isomerase
MLVGTLGFVAAVCLTGSGPAAPEGPVVHEWGAFTNFSAPAAGPAEAEAAPPRLPSIPVPDMPVLKRTVLDGGLIVEDMKLGGGYEAGAGGAVVAHYHGVLKSNPSVVFDSSYNRGEPLGLPLARSIPGWQKGVPGMKVGGIRRLIVPAAMAYGEKSPSAEVPANSDLVFTIELVDVLRVEDVKVGEGEETAASECVAITAYTITDRDGMVVEKHDAGNPYIWVPGEYQAMALGLEGMKRGGKRRIMVPAAFNQSSARFAPSRPANEPVTIEVELLNMKNIPPAAKADGC